MRKCKKFLPFLMVRLFLPAALLIAIGLRPFGLSVIYLLLFLISPLVQVPDSKTIRGARGKFLLTVLFVSILLLLTHVAWHSMLAAFPPYGSLVDNNQLVRKIGFNLGLVSFVHAAPIMVIGYLAPEVLMIIASIIVYVICKKFVHGVKVSDTRQNNDRCRKFPLLVSAGKYLSLFLIMFCGILWPCVSSGIYFVTFLVAATMWALDRLLEKGLAVVGRCVMAIMAVQSLVILAYQCTWAEKLLPSDDIYARMFGLVQVVHLDEATLSYSLHIPNGGRWTMLASPIIVLVTYYVLGVETRELFKPKPKKKHASGVEGGKVNGSLSKGRSFQQLGSRTVNEKWAMAGKKAKMQQVVFPYIDTKTLRGNTSETTPLIRTVSTTKRWSRTMISRQARQDSSGSVVMGDADSDIERQETTLLDDVIAAVIELFQVIIRSSYIATTITMMAWSILYHSWLTFVFLMWANMVWLCQNQRQFMLKTSPILVLYAISLLIVQYVYGMDLTEDELPSTIEEVNLKQIGVSRVEGGPFVPLLIKSLFTCMFWLTLRQRVQDVRSVKQAAALADMAAPLQLTVSTAASVIEAQKEEQSKSRILKAVGDFFRAACARFWIYVVAIMLFVIGITGERMTIFRIIYMFLFLVFILMFQISWYWWRRLMYVFWIIVIIYSMINLILLYVYQFDNFSTVIENYLFINEKLQHDLGLEPYPPADLFVKLLTPTLFLIITIMQVHYFHKDFMALSDYKSRANSYREAESSRRSQGASTIKDDIPPLPEDERDNRSETGRSSALSSYNTAAKQGSYGATTHSSVPFRTWLKEMFTIVRRYVLIWIDGMFQYLHIHLINAIFVAFMLVCVFDVCALHVPVMLTACFALTLKRKKRRLSILFISILISLYLMARMVYQIDYIKHQYFDVTCDIGGPNNTNNFEWLGFQKATNKKPLVSILKGYISLIAILTFNSLVSYKQAIDREMKGLPEKRDELLFPKIRREHADTDLFHCIKYLINYAFYKFGIEITLMCMIGVIGSRMDIYAVVYAVWLLVLVSVSRRALARLWTPFLVFLSIVVPLQYLIAVGFLPEFCITYPWKGSGQQIKHIRNWVFLPYAEEPPHAIKLVFDYFLLLFATLQWRVFRIERRHGESYPGGSNEEDIGTDWETPTFVNPVPDFLGIPGNWLDIFKRTIFLGMLWLTLAIMFMTGTNRVNLFSMGYLIGSFIFLWQGTDFYLLPKESILHWWSWLLRYNVSVVFIKTLLQIPGCIFSKEMQTNACWVVQLLGIGCVDKFAGGSISKFLKMEYVKDSPCSVPQEDIGLAWDGVCFAFLILQRRFFHSYYFFRIIDDSKATAVLASRGAELIEELRMRQMQQQEQQEMNILAKIKVKMEKIKANQRKLQGALAKEPRHHDADEDSETHDEESEQVPLVRGDSDVSGRGFHTPDSPNSPRGFHTPVSETSAPPSPAHTPPPIQPVDPPPPTPIPALPPPSSHGGPPSPSSALLTSLSLDAYLEPRRISFESPPSSDLLPRAQSPEESYPVFSPPPIRRRNTVASPSLLQRTSMISQSSRSEPKSHHDYDESVPRIRRRVYTKRHEARACPPYRPPASHQKAVRSGDYYMFDDFDETDESLTDVKKIDDDVEAPKQMGIGQLLTAVVAYDLKRALLLRRASMPAVRRASRSHSSGGMFSSERRKSLRASKVAISAPEHTPEQSVRLQGDESQPPPPPPPGGPGQGGPAEIGESSGTALEDIAPTPEKETWFDKVRRVYDTITAFVSSFLVSVTRLLMRYSRDYRYVSRTLTLEKKVLKEKEGFGVGLREGTQMRWEPLPEPVHVSRKLSEISVPEIRILAPSMEGGLDASPAPSPARSSLPSPSPTPTDEDGTSEHESAFSLQSTESKEVSLLEGQEGSTFNQDRAVGVQLIFALWYAVLAHTDIVCYIMVFINQIQSATILSIPLPLMVFLWGTLTVPRPTKTFWVTLIAYTEVIVLIKSMFQFEILPWNQKVIPANMPFTAPRIIGIERKKNYALYDLLLLLIIFLHRFMLKSLGLWKETTPEIELREDMEFHIDPQDMQNLVEGRGHEVGKKYIAEHNKIGPRHRLVDRTRHVQALIAEAMEQLGAKRSDPRVMLLVHQRLTALRAAEVARLKRGRRARHVARSASGEPLLDDASSSRQNSGALPTALEDASPERRSDGAPDKNPDEHFKVNDDQEPIIAITTTMDDPLSHYPGVVWLSVKRYLRPMMVFFKRMTSRGARVTADVYAYMFLCDFFNFLVVIFGFAAFGTHQGDGGVQAYLEENKVPIPFLVMLILQFALIVIDRALYLRKFMLGKILFQYALIIGVHIWMFFVLPFITERTFNTLPPPPMWYMIKCIYLLLSAYQIRCGYPRRIIGNFLCKSYRFLNMLSFRGFMAIPFVFELRTLMDWIWTDTSMTLMDWLKMEDIFANVFLLKCSRHMEDEFPAERGQKKSNTAKYLLGGTVLAFVIAIIWFPLVFFAFGNTVGKPNPPTDVTVKIRIGPFLPVYQMSAQSHNIALFSEQDYTQLSNMYARDRTAQTFLSNYMHNDIAVVTINPNSTMKWTISPPELDRLEAEAESNATLTVKFTFVITHPSNTAQNPPTIEDSREVSLEAFIGNQRNPERQTLSDMLTNKANPDTWLNVKMLFPKFVKVFNKGTVRPAPQLMPPPPLDDPDAHLEARSLYRDVQLRLERDRNSMYWRVRESCTRSDLIIAIPRNNCNMLVLYTFNDKLFPETLNFISGGGIIGLYTTFVFLASRIIRGFFSGIYTKIMFDDLPNCDRVLQLCLDIYLVREALELALEEDLFAKLVFLYRSPETMIKWSRPKEEEDETRALPPSR